MIEKFWLWLFLKSGARLWPCATVYNNDEDKVLVIHFSRDELTLIRSMHDYLDSVEPDHDIRKDDVS